MGQNCGKYVQSVRIPSKLLAQYSWLVRRMKYSSVPSNRTDTGWQNLWSLLIVLFRVDPTETSLPHVLKPPYPLTSTRTTIPTTKKWTLDCLVLLSDGVRSTLYLTMVYVFVSVFRHFHVKPAKLILEKVDTKVEFVLFIAPIIWMILTTLTPFYWRYMWLKLYAVMVVLQNGSISAFVSLKDFTTHTSLYSH